MSELREHIAQALYESTWEGYCWESGSYGAQEASRRDADVALNSLRSFPGARVVDGHLTIPWNEEA